MNINGGGPPPGKIRRRNALVESDIFPLAHMMQRLENINSAAINAGNPTSSATAGGSGNPLHVDMGHLCLDVKRKKAVPRHARETQQIPKAPDKQQYSTEASSLDVDDNSDFESEEGEKQMRVILHSDLINAPKTQFVPQKLVEQYVKKETHALVLYRPPEQIVGDILSRSRDTISGTHDASPQQSNVPSDVDMSESDD
jgi:hypothetical protein